MRKLTVWFVLILVSLCEISAYKILLVSPLPGKSHAILAQAMAEHLTGAGHEVTYITVFPPEKPIPRVTVVDLSDNLKHFNVEEVMNITKILDKTIDVDDSFAMGQMLMDMCRHTLENPNMRKLLTDENEKFDAVVAEWMFNDAYAGLAEIFECPLIWFSTIEPHWMILRLVDEMPNPAYTTQFLSPTVPPLTFTQRVNELTAQALGRLIQIFWVSGLEHGIYEDYLAPLLLKRRGFVPPLETLRFNASLVLSNSHVSMGIPLRLPANFIPIGGFHIKNDVKPLPEDLQKIMDNAKNGVIYFSMGSNLRSKNLPNEIKQGLLKLFGKLKQTIIWKFEEDLQNRPSNVHIVKWAPQPSILAHKNCVMFITHGGLLSTTETIHFGVPIIGIPVFADQFVNIARAVHKGFALKVALSYTMAADMEIAINDLLDNPKYAKKAKELSLIYHDRPVPPAKELVHWVEHVVKTKGAPHLRSPAFMVPWYQKLYLDLVLVLAVIILFLKYSFVFVKAILLTKKKQKIN